MKKFIFYSLFFFIFFTFSTFGYCEKTSKVTPEEVLEKIHWLGQATVKIDAGSQIIYFDPHKINSFNELQEFVCSFIWSHSDFWGEYRNSSNFVGTHLIPLDVDNDGELTCTLEQAKEYFA